jgi:hypothetical protein
MMQNTYKKISTAFIIGLFFVITGCGSTSVNDDHILVESEDGNPAANVYFIRPFTYRERGISDNPVKIELNRKELITLGKGEYTLVHIKPVDATITTRSFTMHTNKLMPVEISRSANMHFEHGQTYFIHIRQVNEEFRGVYYLPELIGLETAKRMTAELRADGAARSAEIEDL